MRTRWMIAVTVCFFMACEPKPETEKLLDQFIVSTNYDTTANFASYATYALPTDTIGFYSNASNDTIITEGNSDVPRLVINQIKSNMDDRGYSLVDKNQHPDLGISISIVNDFNVFQQVVYGGYGGYGGFGYGYYYPGYYGYGGYSYPYVNTYASNTGVLIIEIIDLKNKTAKNTVKGIWTVNMGDVYSTVNLSKEITEGIDQSFKQSPYLKK